MRRGNFGEVIAHCKVQGHSAVSCAETAELIDLPFGLWTQVGRMKHKFSRIRYRAHWLHLANTIEPMRSYVKLT